MGDRQISRALGHIHRRPDLPWTVEELARVVGMSRSSFSNRFSDLVGRTPHKYLTMVRMQKAAEILAATEEPLATIAGSVGYQSEAAFSAAFNRQIGIRPGEYRRRRQGQHARRSEFELV